MCVQPADRSDAVLIVWLVCSSVWDILVFGFTSYEVFWKSHSGWWFVFAILITYSESLLKALRKRFGIAQQGGNRIK
jgi:hypothetical protein